MIELSTPNCNLRLSNSIGRPGVGLFVRRSWRMLPIRRSGVAFDASILRKPSTDRGGLSPADRAVWPPMSKPRYPTEPRWLIWAREMQALSQTGLAFTQDQ